MVDCVSLHSPVRMSACYLCIGLLQISLGTLWLAADTQAAFTIDQVTLTLLPGHEVATGTNVTLRCEAKVSHSLPQPLTYTFSFLQDDQVVYSKNISDAAVGRSLSPARVSNSGLYKCSVRIYDKFKKSNGQRLTVTGFQTPLLKVRSDIVSEGEDIVATCSAREETGSLMFFFYENDQEVKRVTSSNNSVMTTLTMQKLRDTYLQCAYMVMMQPKAGNSNKSNTVKVIVQDLEVITPKIHISPKANVVEGDQVQITCHVQYPSDLEVFLTKGSTVLHKFHTGFSHNFTVRVEDSGKYVCKAEKGSVQKMATYWLNVAELFSRPILRLIPDQVFEGERFHLNCSSAINSTQRISRADIKYDLLKENRLIASLASYGDTARLATNGKYSCMAEAKGINKTSLPLVFKAKVPVSAPVIRAVGKVIVGRSFKVLCEAENGTLPITFTLMKGHSPLADVTVVEAADKAFFDITYISSPQEIYSFNCQAHNQGPSLSMVSGPLRAPVIVPVSKPVLMVEPKGFTVTEGSDLVLICSVQQGTDPITFTWYHYGDVIPFSTQEVRHSQGTHVVKAIKRDQRGSYYCEASNHAIDTRRSLPVTIAVSLAIWKKALIGVFCILLLVAIVIVLTVFFKKMSNPRRKKQATELSVKPSRPKSGDPMRMSLTLDIDDNTALNGTPCVMGRNVWSENVSGSESDDQSKEDSELVHPQEMDPSKEVLMKKAMEYENSVQYTEVQVSTQGVLEQTEGAALEYVQLSNSEQEPA
ncbi:platelet endothelial cell adhesion molecule isoform X2 [Myxocyprinus asiaticus]|uniref:platelet endothelial cell adhesion molecule isoform X2 n=1 Tax=Myxocyprinus asiaticus TaxID=70543 RepID=UPI0022237F06|nr:platelet endothelial cell adhesion molecule isoform X2 [Myxocyprinus asiaticus]